MGCGLGVMGWELGLELGVMGLRLCEIELADRRLGMLKGLNWLSSLKKLRLDPHRYCELQLAILYFKLTINHKLITE